MANIQDLDINVVKKLLSINNIKIPINKDKIYDKAFDLMNEKSTSYKDVSSSIIEWMLAYNALNNNPINKFYHIEDIRQLSLIEKNKLAKRLGMKKNNIENIINILRYMHKLEGELKFEENIDLYIPLILNSDFDTILKLLKSKPSLKNLILNILPEIMDNNHNKNSPIISNNFISKLVDLIDPEDIYFIRKTIISYLIEKRERYFNLFTKFFDNKRLDLFFKILSEEKIDFLMERDGKMEINASLKRKTSFDKDKYYYFIHQTLKYAIKYRLLINMSYISDLSKDLRNTFTEKQNDKIQNLILEYDSKKYERYFFNEDYFNIKLNLDNNIFPTQELVNELALNNKYVGIILLAKKGIFPDQEYINYASDNNYKFIINELAKYGKFPE